MHDSLGDRIKRYEQISSYKLITRMPVIIRLDGRAFHTFTKSLTEPFNEDLHLLMVESTKRTMEQMQNAVLGYTQSDEISILLTDWNTYETQQWFNANLIKIVSVSSSILTANFNYLRSSTNKLPEIKQPYATFDSRAFNLTVEEVNNYFTWRQQDASRNSVQMLGRHYFSHKELQNKNNSQIQDMLMLQHGVNWNDLSTWKKRGTCVTSKGNATETESYIIDTDIPIFTQDRQYINKYLVPDYDLNK